MTDNVLLVDTDVLCYGIAFSNQRDVDWDDDGNVEHYTTPEKALVQVEEFINDLKDELDGTDCVLVLSEYPSFRQELEPEYKANRNPKDKPVLWKTIRDFIEWGDHPWTVESAPRLEGDDVLGILHTSAEFAGRSTIVSIDKDMLTIPGRIFLWNKQGKERVTLEIDEQEACFNHLYQTLTGDSVDNYKGCPGVGEKRALNYLDPDDDPEEMWESVVRAYTDAMLKAVEKGRLPPFDDPRSAAIHQARQAYILRDGDYNFETNKVTLWNPTRLS